MLKCDNLVEDRLTSGDVEHFPELLDGEGDLKRPPAADDVNVLDATPGLQSNTNKPQLKALSLSIYRVSYFG